ncbi:hypothetical protein E6O75_ATG03667 [Venturia nashicola]|uniref:ferric-chelate reductase (NADPH) n=1 Tax=Venturia nashicola TaxID=86259 RepID=A0A4Z1PSL9_9PEZI|nr:hypothetical protein E6O75_ATG03667 [Venturia nashicola]
MDMGNVAWLTYPLALHGTRAFDCEDLTPDQCVWYKQRWHYWYIADWVFALPTIAFFMSAIGIFIIGHFISNALGYRRFRGPAIWQKLIASIRYLSYRGFHVKALRWNSAPVGVLLLGLAGLTFFFCMDLIPQPYYWAESFYGDSPALATRSGWLALACMPFVFATASKTNWITLVTGVSHERLQVFHRWIAYAFFILSLLHTFPFIVYHIHWHSMKAHFMGSLLFYWTGIVAIIFQAWLTFASHSTIRKMNYEFFKFMHFAAAIVFMIVLFWHCDYTLTSWDYFIATAAVYVPCYVYPWLRTLFEYGTGQKATLTIEENGFTRITIPANFTWTPGQHCFLRFTSFGIMKAVSAHPFTICSLPVPQGGANEMVFYIRHQGGFTKTLYEFALKNPGVQVGVMVDGPYGGINMQKYYDGDHNLVIAGGSGAGWILPFIERFARDQINHSSEYGDEEKAIEHGCCETPAVAKQQQDAPTSLRIILATRDLSSRVWFLRTVNEVFAKYPMLTRTKDINIQVYLTGEAMRQVDLSNSKKDDLGETTSSDGSLSSTDNIAIPTKQDASFGLTNVPGKEFEDRPRLAQIIHEEGMKLTQEGRSMGVYICGPETMQNDVRNAVAAENLQIVKGAKRGGVYLHSEHFSWA